ncbi:gypsy type transposase [Tanacetum coccineum]|uniref:Gypsy type transposase n=1 Tax=Tanacetum coccineum TaxID=301880 RepID=A0ABQ5EEJ3_9ASTR
MDLKAQVVKASKRLEVDLPHTEIGKVRLRFALEQSVYLHIGHLKDASLNQYFPQNYDGKLIICLDDTNPAKENNEFVDNILKDIKTAGKAFIDDTPRKQMKKQHMDGIDSKCRNNTVPENIELWKEMLVGSYKGLKCCLRGKLDMQDPNKSLCDPVYYRCNPIPHQRIGPKYKIYPKYDLSCAFVDSIQGITHALQSSEYHDRNAQSKSIKGAGSKDTTFTKEIWIEQADAKADVEAILKKAIAFTPYSILTTTIGVFPSNISRLSPATCHWGNLSPSKCRWGMVPRKSSSGIQSPAIIPSEDVAGVGPLSGKGPRVIVSADVSILSQSVFVRGGATDAALKVSSYSRSCKGWNVYPILRLCQLSYPVFYLLRVCLTHFRIPFSQLSVFGSAKVDEFVVPANARFSWFSGSNIVKDRAPVPSEYNVEHVNTLIAKASPFLRFPEEFLCWVGISRNYLLNNDTYPRFEDIDLNAFIHTADPRKVRIVERARAEHERPIVTVAKHRTVTLLPTSVSHPFGELSDSIEREPKRLKKKRVIRGRDGTPATSHPPKRLRADYGRTGGSTAGGKSPGVLNKLLQDSRLSVEQGVIALPTLPFITSFVTASPLEDGGDHTDFVTGPSLWSVAASARSVVAVMTEATTMTTIATTVAIPADVGKDKSVPHPSIFGSSSSFEKTDRTLSLFTGRSGSGFVARSIRAEEVIDAGLEEIYVPEWTVTKDFELNNGCSCANMIDHFTPPAFFKIVRRMEHEQLFAEFNVSATRNLSLSSEVRMRAGYNILEKRKCRSLAKEKDSLLGAKDKEIEELRSQLLKAKEESVVVAQLRARVSSLEAIEGSLQGEVASVKRYNDLLEQERNVLRLQVASLKSTVVEKDHELSDLEISSSSLRSQNQGLVSQVHELETSSAHLREQLDLYEENMKRLEEFQDNHMRPLETRLAEIDADFTRCYMRFQESFHSHLLNVVVGRRWLLTHGMKLLMAKCLNSTEYMEALINAFGRAIEKGMQEGLAVDFNSAVCDLRGLTFSLLHELSNKKDASTWDVMDLLRLDDAMAEALGMTDLQLDVNQLMVHVHHKQDMVVIGSQALSVALDICRGRVEKIERNLVERLPFLKDVFVSLYHLLSAEALIEPPVVVPATNAT